MLSSGVCSCVYSLCVCVYTWTHPAQLLVLQRQHPGALGEQLHLDGGQRVGSGEVPLGPPPERHKGSTSHGSIPLWNSVRPRRETNPP